MSSRPLIVATNRADRYRTLVALVEIHREDDDPKQQADPKGHSAGDDLILGGGGDECPDRQQASALQDQAEIADRHRHEQAEHRAVPAALGEPARHKGRRDEPEEQPVLGASRPARAPAARRRSPRVGSARAPGSSPVTSPVRVQRPSRAVDADPAIAIRVDAEARAAWSKLGATLAKWGGK